ncbi:MAG TPA: hypothetical protein VMU75_04940 [Acidimicrobiales bacterium]|nr:hypothetical protein [Acidimicrobiales bacterium]
MAGARSEVAGSVVTAVVDGAVDVGSTEAAVVEGVVVGGVVVGGDGAGWVGVVGGTFVLLGLVMAVVGDVLDAAAGELVVEVVEARGERPRVVATLTPGVAGWRSPWAVVRTSAVATTSARASQPARSRPTRRVRRAWRLRRGLARSAASPRRVSARPGEGEAIGSAIREEMSVHASHAPRRGSRCT